MSTLMSAGGGDRTRTTLGESRDFETVCQPPADLQIPAKNHMSNDLADLAGIRQVSQNTRNARPNGTISGTVPRLRTVNSRSPATQPIKTGADHLSEVQGGEASESSGSTPDGLTG